MNVKNVVKVMNFHSLLRVDKARKEAEKYFMVEKELRRIIDVVTNNRNFMLDRHMLRVDKNAPVLNIYIGSDLGFCAGYNSVVNERCRRDTDSEKILIGKKIYPNMTNVIASYTKEEYLEDRHKLTDLLTNGITNQEYSQINVLYNHYVNAGQIVWKDKRIFPLDATSEETDADYRSDYREDFVCESNINELLISLVVTYISMELQMTVKNSLASENIMRQNATTESLKKIDEIEEEQVRVDRKIKTAKSTQKITESFTRQKYLNGD